MTATSPGRPGPVGREREATAPEATVLPGTALADLTWPELEADARAGRTVLLVPIGSCEQHGAHLPLDTDARIATGLAQRAAAQRPRVAMVAPPLAYGASGEHAGFPGTLSIGQAALELVLVELGRSADDFGAVVFIQGHGGNARPAERAVATLAAEGRRVRSWWPVIPGGDAHAGRTETSLLLHLDPAAVRPEG